MSEPRIRDIPSLKKLLDDVKGFEALKKCMPLLRPVLRLLGANVSELEKILAKGESLQRQTEELTSLPDRFNTQFAPRGWIAYDTLNLDLVKAAVEKAEGGDLDAGEAILVDHYSEDNIRMKLTWIGWMDAFRPRLPLAEKALADYAASRYHACVPVILALLDGFVDDLQDRGFFAAGVDLTAWDSIAAHEKGLGQLVQILTQPRKKTRTEAITLPYRHGILHGRDLGYDNKLVAAKTWAALFATGDWAAKIVRGHKTAPPEKSEPTLLDTLRELGEIKAEQARMEKWKPRSVTVGKDVPPQGGVEAYEENSPERALVEFLNYWRARNYGKMAGCLPRFIREPVSVMAGDLRAHYSEMLLQDFCIESVVDVGPAVTELRVKCTYSNCRKSEEVFTFRMVCEDAEGGPVMRGKPETSWVVQTRP